MKIPFGDMKRDYNEIKKEIDEAVQKILSSGWYVLGEEGREFEREFAEYCGTKYCVGCASGTEAIALSLMALDIKAGDEVITTNITAIPTISAISMVGATPVLVDVEKDTCLIDHNKIEAKITDRTKAILPVHLYGQPCDMDKINALGKKYGIPVIEDACQAHGSEYKGKKTGGLGIMACFSFYPSKNLGAYGDGGAITTDSEEIYNKLMMLRNYGQSKRYYHDIVGINSRLDEMQAAILRVKLKHLDDWNKRRREIAEMYNELINNPIIEKATEKEYNKMNYHLYVIKADDRNKIQEILNEKGIGTFIHYPVNVHMQQAYNHLKCNDEEFEVSKNCSQRILSLPMYPQLTDEEVKYICEQLNKL